MHQDFNASLSDDPQTIEKSSPNPSKHHLALPNNVFIL
jgi:hypothetical protein